MLVAIALGDLHGGLDLALDEGNRHEVLPRQFHRRSVLTQLGVQKPRSFWSLDTDAMRSILPKRAARGLKVPGCHLAPRAWGG